MSTLLDFVTFPDSFTNSHAVEELPVCLIAFAFRHQAVQLVNQLGLHLEEKHLKLRGSQSEQH